MNQLLIGQAWILQGYLVNMATVKYYEFQDNNNSNVWQAKFIYLA